MKKPKIDHQLGKRLFKVPTRAYKLLRVRRDGTLGPLFINCRQVIPMGVWLKSEDHPTKGYARRPGWHTAPRPEAPHLSLKGRVWCRVTIEDYRELHRPACQGGTWWLAEWMRVDKVIGAHAPNHA